MPKSNNWKSLNANKKSGFQAKKDVPNSEPEGRLRSKNSEKPEAENKLILCALSELQELFNSLLCPRCQKNNLNLKPTVHKSIRQFVSLS